MKTPEGDVVLCPGCPQTGTFIGPLIQPSLESGNIAEAQPGFNPALEGYIALFDDDGGQSEMVFLSEEAQRLPNASDKDAEETGLAFEQRMYQRVGKCITGTVRKAEECPAFNDVVASTVLIEEFQRVTTRDSEEGKASNQ
jgi:hypothetical protein